MPAGWDAQPRRQAGAVEQGGSGHTSSAQAAGCVGSSCNQWHCTAVLFRPPRPACLRLRWQTPPHLPRTAPLRRCKGRAGRGQRPQYEGHAAWRRSKRTRPLRTGPQEVLLCGYLPQDQWPPPVCPCLAVLRATRAVTLPAASVSMPLTSRPPCRQEGRAGGLAAGGEQHQEQGELVCIRRHSCSTCHAAPHHSPTYPPAHLNLASLLLDALDQRGEDQLAHCSRRGGWAGRRTSVSAAPTVGGAKGQPARGTRAASGGAVARRDAGG